MVVGTGIPKKCDISIENVLNYKDVLGGVALSGLTDGSEEFSMDQLHPLAEIFKRIGVSWIFFL